jgi:hypothetical protein
LSAATHPSVVPPIDVVVVSASYPAHPKSIPKEWDRSTSPTVCNFKWLNLKGKKRCKVEEQVSYAVAPKYQQDISFKVPTQTLNTARKHLVPQGPVSTAYLHLGSMRSVR